MNVSSKPVTGAALSAVDIDVLRTFTAIAETGSFSRAAEKVFRTPSAVSMQVKKLEDILGVSVFERDSRSVKLTPHGEMLLSYARRILALSNEMMAKFITPDIEGTVRLGAPDDYGNKMLPEVLKRFSETHPNVAVDVVMDATINLKERFKAGELDVLVFTESPDRPLEPNDMVLYEGELVWAGLKGGCAYEREELPVAMWEEGCAWRRGAVEALDKVSRSFRVAYKSAHVSAQRAAVGADLAVAPMPAFFIDAPLMRLTEKEHGLPPIGKFQVRMRMKDHPGCCSEAVADHVIACFDGMGGR